MTKHTKLHKLHTRCVAGWSSLVARRAHNPKAVGSNPAPATTVTYIFCGAYALFLYKKMMKDEIEKIVKPVIERHECFLWGIEILRGRKRPTLRVYIESELGATIDDCEKISKDLNYEIDLDSSFGDDYILEVSTPGISRRFFKQSQLEPYLGEDLKIKLREPIEGIKNIEGTLVDCNKEHFLIESKNLEYKLDFSDIDFCKLEPNFDKLMKEENYAK